MSCLFDSLSKSTTNVSSYELRQICCNFLEKDPLLIGSDHFSNLIKPQTIRNYILNMRKKNTWGSAFEIRAFCEIYNVIVFVKTPTNKNIEFRPKRLHRVHVPKQIYLDWNGVHYEPM